MTSGLIVEFLGLAEGVHAMKIRLSLLCAAALVATPAVPAEAATFLFSIDSTSGVGSGTLETDADGTSMGRVLTLSGTFGGSPMLLLAPGTYPAGAPNDNLFNPTAPFFTFSGLSFSAGGQSFNLFDEFGTVALCGRTDECTIDERTSFSASLVPTAAIPEPSTWAMLLLGFGLVGTVLRRTRRRVMAFA